MSEQQQLLGQWAAEDAGVEALARRHSRLERCACPRCGKPGTLTKDGVRWSEWKCQVCGQTWTRCRWDGCDHIHLTVPPPRTCAGCGSWYRLEASA